jgi:hypothetical protein
VSAATAAAHTGIGCASFGSAPKKRPKFSCSIVWWRTSDSSVSSSARVGSSPWINSHAVSRKELLSASSSIG